MMVEKLLVVFFAVFMCTPAVTVTRRMWFNDENVQISPGTMSSFPALPQVPTTPAATSLNDDNCQIENGMIYYHETCYSLLSSQACQNGQWLIVDLQGTPHCTVRPCPLGELFCDGKCISLADPSVCGVFEILYVEFTGETYCDCEPDFIYDKTSEKCEAEYRQGSCPDGTVLELKEKHVTCVTNNCTSDDFIYNTEDGKCYKKTYVDSCSTENKFKIIFNDVRMTATCITTSNRNIFEVSTLSSCARGSKRDFLNQCQKVIEIRGPSSSKSKRKVPTTYISRYSCPSGYVRYPNKECRKKNNLFNS